MAARNRSLREDAAAHFERMLARVKKAATYAEPTS